MSATTKLVALLTSAAAVGATTVGIAAPAEAAACYASNGDLYCGNRYNARIMKRPAYVVWTSTDPFPGVERC